MILSSFIWEKIVFYAKKQRYYINTTLKKAIIDTCQKLMHDPKFNGCVPFLENITMECLLKKIESTLVDDFEVLPFYNDKITSLSELSSSSSNVVDGYPIEISFENLRQICKGFQDFCLMSTKSLSTLSIKSLDNNTVFDVLLNLKTIGFNSMNYFFWLTVKKENNKKDILHSIIKFHVDRFSLDAVVGQLLLNHDPLISIASYKKFNIELYTSSFPKYFFLFITSMSEILFYI